MKYEHYGVWLYGRLKAKAHGKSISKYLSTLSWWVTDLTPHLECVTYVPASARRDPLLTFQSFRVTISQCLLQLPATLKQAKGPTGGANTLDGRETELLGTGTRPGWPPA